MPFLNLLSFVVSKQTAGCAGRLNGELNLRCHDAASWRFPSFSGKVACRALNFHFWDAVDDLSRTDIDLVFDDQRLYMHNASGLFGSVPLTLSGDPAFPCTCCVFTMCIIISIIVTVIMIILEHICLPGADVSSVPMF